MIWIKGAPPDMGELDNVWVVVEIPSLYTKRVAYGTALWSAGRWCTKEVSRATRWALLDLPKEARERYVEG